MGLDPCRGSRVRAWSHVPLLQALRLLPGMLNPRITSSPAAGAWGCSSLGQCSMWLIQGGRWGCQHKGVALGTPAAPGSCSRTAGVKSCPCQLIHLRHSQAGPGGSTSFGSSKWGWRRMQFWRTRYPCKTCEKKRNRIKVLGLFKELISAEEIRAPFPPAARLPARLHKRCGPRGAQAINSARKRAGDEKWLLFTELRLPWVALGEAAAPATCGAAVGRGRGSVCGVGALRSSIAGTQGR